MHIFAKHAGQVVHNVNHQLMERATDSDIDVNAQQTTSDGLSVHRSPVSVAVNGFTCADSQDSHNNDDSNDGPPLFSFINI